MSEIVWENVNERYMSGKGLDTAQLARQLAGIFGKPAAATSVATAKRLRAAGVIAADELVVCNLVT